jgi:hypothetical protein
MTTMSERVSATVVAEAATVVTTVTGLTWQMVRVARPVKTFGASP